MLSSTPRFLIPRRLHRKTRLVTGHPSTLARDLKNDEDDNNRKASGQFAGSWPLSSWDSACHPGVTWRTPLVRNPFRLASAQDLGILNNAYPTQDPGPRNGRPSRKRSTGTPNLHDSLEIWPTRGLPHSATPRGTPTPPPRTQKKSPLRLPPPEAAAFKPSENSSSLYRAHTKPRSKRQLRPPQRVALPYLPLVYQNLERERPTVLP